MRLRVLVFILVTLLSNHLSAQIIPGTQFLGPKLLVEPEAPYRRAFHSSIMQVDHDKVVLASEMGTAPFSVDGDLTETIEVIDYETKQVIFTRTEDIIYFRNDDAEPDLDEVLIKLGNPIVKAHGDVWVVAWRQKYYWSEPPCGWDGVGISCWPFYRDDLYIAVSWDGGASFSESYQINDSQNIYAKVTGFDFAIDDNHIFFMWTEYQLDNGEVRLKSTRRDLLYPFIHQEVRHVHNIDWAMPGAHELFGPKLMLDSDRGLLIGCWCTSDFQDSLGEIYCANSDNGAQSWQSGFESVNEMDGAAGYLDAAIDEEGILHVAWTDRRDYLTTGDPDTDIKYRRLSIEQAGSQYYLVGGPAVYVNSQADDGRPGGYSNQYVPQIAIADGRIGIVFLSTVPFDAENHKKVIYTESKDDGMSWSMEDEIDFGPLLETVNFNLWGGHRSFGIAPLRKGFAMFASARQGETSSDTKLNIYGIRDRASVNPVRRPSGRATP
jgi:hypothetical protein